MYIYHVCTFVHVRVHVHVCVYRYHMHVHVHACKPCNGQYIHDNVQCMPYRCIHMYLFTSAVYMYERSRFTPLVLKARHLSDSVLSMVCLSRHWGGLP